MNNRCRGYDRQIGRIRLNLSEDGAKMHDYGHGCSLYIRSGWNDSCKMVNNYLSVEELHDLRHLIDRAISAAGSK